MASPLTPEYIATLRQDDRPAEAAHGLCALLERTQAESRRTQAAAPGLERGAGAGEGEGNLSPCRHLNRSRLRLVRLDLATSGRRWRISARLGRFRGGRSK